VALISNSIFPEEKVPVGYGCHPKLVYSYKKFLKETLKRNRKGKSWDKNRISLADIPKSGNVYLIPRDKYIDVIDESGDLVAVEGLDKATFPFSSYDLYADIFEDKYFNEKNITIETLRTAPDFAVIYHKTREVRLIEVKYLHTLSADYVLKYANKMSQSWNPSYLFIATLKGFYFDEINTIIKNKGKISQLNDPQITNDLQAKYLQILIDFEKNN